MESFIRYLASLEKYNNRLFYSFPPSTALIVWSNINALPAITGISFVTSNTATYNSGLPYHRILQILRDQIGNSIPVVEIFYDFQNGSIQIDGVEYNLIDGAIEMSTRLNIYIGPDPAKVPNNPTMISDPFHIWSREAFDGNTTKKTDIDLLIKRNGLIHQVIEIKRSNKIKVGKWTPFVVNDGPNYLMQISLARILNCSFITVHHEEMDGSAVFSGSEYIEIFQMNQPIGEVDVSLLNTFANPKNRRIGRLKDFIA